MSTGIHTVVRGTKRLSAAALVSKGRNHVRMISGNPAYPELQVFMAPLAAECDTLDAVSMYHAFNKGRIELEGRNKGMAVVCRLIDQLAGAVTTHANNDLIYIIGTGFDVKQKGGTSKPLPAPANMRATRTAYPGVIKLQWGGVPNRIIYIIEYATSDPGLPDSWQRLDSTTLVSYDAVNLQSDIHYFFRVRAVGVAGVSPVSDLATAKAA